MKLLGLNRNPVEEFTPIAINERQNLASVGFRSNFPREVVTENPSSKATATCQSQVRELSEREAVLGDLDFQCRP